MGNLPPLSTFSNVPLLTPKVVSRKKTAFLFYRDSTCFQLIKKSTRLIFFPITINLTYSAFERAMGERIQ